MLSVQIGAVQSVLPVFLFLVFVKRSLYQLHTLDYRDHEDREPHRDCVLQHADRSEAEGAVEPRDVDHGCREYQGKHHRADQVEILPLHGEYRFSDRAHIERVEDLRHRHRKESHGHTVR